MSGRSPGSDAARPPARPAGPGDQRRGVRDAATVLPFLALVLLMPPIILIFATTRLVAGVPLIIVYIFGVWAAIIVAAFLLARALARSSPVAFDDEARDSPPPDVF